MVDAFKKYQIDRSKYAATESVDLATPLKREVITSRREEKHRELEAYDSLEQYRQENNNVVPFEVENYFTARNIQKLSAASKQYQTDQRKREALALVKDRDSGTYVGGAINTVAGVGKTLSRWGANTLSAPDTMTGHALLDNIPEDVMEIWSVLDKGERELTEEENTRLDSSDSRGLGTRFVKELVQNPSNPIKASLDALDNSTNWMSYRDRLSNASQALEHAGDITEGVESIGIEKLHNPIKNERLIDDLNATYAKHAEYFTQASKDIDNKDWTGAVVNTMIGVGKALKDAGGDLWENPDATFEFIVEQAPYLALGAYSKTILGSVNAAYATDIYRKKLTEYEEEHGRPPSQEDRGSLFTWSTTAALAEQVGSMGMLRALQGRAGFSKAVTKIIEKAPDVVTKAATNVASRNLAAMTKTMAKEGLTEVYQTAVEESKDNPFDRTTEGKELFVAGVLGAAAGGGFASVGSTGDILSSMAGETVKAVDRASKDRPALRRNKTLVNRYADEIMKGTRKMESLLNSEDIRTYDPALAAGLHLVKSADPEATPEAQAENRQSAEKIMEGLSQEVIDLRGKLDAETNKVERKKISKKIRETEEFLRRSSDAVAAVKSTEARIAQNNEEAEADRKLANQEEVTEESKAAATRVINSMILNSDLESGESIFEKIGTLRESPSITEEQKEYIDSIEATFKAQDAMVNSNKKSKEVTQNILKGDVGFKGILEYRRDVNRALKKGDTEKAVSEIDKLRSFAREHKNKLDAAKAARAKAVETGGSTFIHKDPNTEKGWRPREVAKAPIPWRTRREQSQLGGFQFRFAKNGEMTGADFISNIEKEVAMINSMGIELSKAVKTVNSQSAPAQASAATAATAVDQAPETVQSAPEMNLEEGFDASVVPQRDEGPSTPTGNIDVDQQTSTTPETAQESSQEVENTQNQTNRTQSEASGDNLTEPATAETEAVSDPVQEERLDVAGLARLFNIENDTGNPTSTGTVNQVLEAQAKIIELVLNNKITKAGLAAALDWLHTADVEADPLRMERATYKKTDHKTGEKLSEEQIAKNKAKFERRSKGNTRQYIARQLIEELGELVLEKLIAEGRNTTELETLLEAQKRVLKSERFGEDTVIKDPNSPYDGQTNRQAAITATEQVGVENAANKDSDTLIQELNTKVLALINNETEVSVEEEITRLEETIEEADTTTQAQAAPAAQEPDVGVEAQTEPEQENQTITWDEIKFTRKDYLAVAQEAGLTPEQVVQITNENGWVTKDALNQLISGQDLEAETQLAPAKKSSDKPLTKVTNFMTHWLSKPEQFIETAQEFLVKEINERQAANLGLFAQFAKVTGKTLRRINKKDRTTYLYQDLTKEFGDTMPEDMRAAVVAAAFTVIAEDGGKTQNYDSDINALLNRDNDKTVSYEERRALGQRPIVRQNTFARKLGKRAIQFLDYKVSPEEGAHKIRNLEAALGAYAIAMMLEEGLISKEESVDPVFRQNEQTVLKDDLGRVINDRITHNIVWINTENSDVKNIVEGSRKTGSVVSKLFGGEYASQEPSSKPGSYKGADTNTKNEDDVENTPLLKENTPTILGKILEKVSKRKQVLNQEVGNKLLNLPTAIIQKLAGVRLPEDGSIHKVNEDSVEATNKSIIRDLDSWVDFRESNGNDFFYLKPVVWLQQRVGLAHTVMNPQSSKVHRHLMYPKSWETEVDPSADSIEMTWFKIGVAQGMGFPVDKNNLAASVAHFEELIKSPVILDGIKAVQSDNPTEAEQEAIVTAVKKGGENLWSFHMLVEMGKYLEAKPFTTNAMVEIDGVTNGPALTNLMLGTIGPWLGSKVGMVQSGFGVNGEQLRNHSHFKESGGRDLYESLANLVQQKLQNMMRSNADSYQTVNDILFFTGSFADSVGRNRVKTPLTSLMFGAGQNATVDNMSEEFIELYYEAIEKSDDNSDYIAQREIQTRINRLLPTGNKVTDITEPLTPSQKNQIKRQFTDFVGEAVKEALTAQYGTLIERRTSIYTASKALFEVYRITRETLVSAALEEGIANGTIKTDDKGNPIGDISTQAYNRIDRRLGDIMPTIHTALSKLSDSRDKNKGLMLAKKNRQEDLGSKIYKQVVIFDDAIKGNKGRPDKNGNRSDSKYVRITAEKLSWDNPGVRAVVLGIHATDSAIASRTYSEFDGLNVHDAIGFSIKDVLKGGTALNRNTFRIMAEYSLPLELLSSLESSNIKLQEFYKEFSNLEHEINAINVGTEEDPIPYDRQLIEAYAAEAIQMEKDKLEFMLGLDSISQYSLDGTEYSITDQDRSILQGLLNNVIAKEQAYPSLAPVQHVEINTERQVSPTQTVWGTTGDARHSSDPKLVQLFQEGKTTAAELAANLETRLKEGNRTPELMKFEIGLLRAAMKIVNPNMEIRLIKPDTPPIEGIDTLQNSIGFYHPDGWIGVKSPEFVDSGITTEMLLHELLHAATRNTLDAVQNGREKDPVAVQAVKDLENLLTQARALIQKEELSQFEAATQNVSELISWGLTNADFQEQVLSKIEVTQENQQNLIDRVKSSGFAKFIRAMSELIFRNREKEATTSGLGSLVINSALIIKQAAAKKAPATENRDINSMSAQPGAFSMTPQEIFDALGSNKKPMSKERGDYLKGMLTNVVEAVFQDGAFKEIVQRESPFTAEDVFIENIKNGEPSFNSDIANALNLSEQERYVLESVELAMRNTLTLKDGRVRAINREAYLMWRDMQKAGKENLFAGDWNTLSQDQKDYYTSLYDSIFKVEMNSDNRTAFLSKFLAAAAVYPPLSEAMGRRYLQKSSMDMQGLNMLERVKRIMEIGWSALMRYVTKARTGDNYHAGALKMIKEMVRLEKKRQARLEKAIKRGETGFEAKANKLAEGVREGVSKLANTAPFRHSKVSAVALTSNLVNLTMQGRVGVMMDNIKKIRDGASGNKVGFWGQSWVELRGDDDVLAKLTQLLSDTKTLEQTRKRYKIEVGKDVKNAFEGTLTNAESEALTKVLLRSDAHILLDNYSMAEILELVANQSKRKAKIADLISQLPSADRAYYSEQARALGMHMATGKVKSALLMRNAHNIANKLGTSQKYKVPKDVAAAAEPVIDEIATLIAIENLGAAADGTGNYRALAANVMTRELARNTEEQNLNGVEFLLRAHKEMTIESQKSLFGSDKTQIVKGYTKDTYDPYVDVVVARRSDWENLEKGGYKRIPHEILKDDADPRNEEFAIFTARNGGLGQSVTAIFNNVDGQRQGTSVLGDVKNSRGGSNQRNQIILNKIGTAKSSKIKKLMAGQVDNQGNTSLVPVLDTKGNIISWRYMMTEATRDSVLGRDNDVGDVMGNIASSILDKSQTPLLNENAVTALRNIYEENFVENSEAFIEFGPNSQDPEIRERYALLPQATKKSIRDIWGREGMLIRNDTYNILFGYRKASIGDVLKVEPENRNAIQKILAGILGEYELHDERGEVSKRIAGNKGLGKRILQTEAVWQEIVTQIKDILVIKSLFTLLGNESSNFTVLLMHGVNPLEIVRSKIIAYASTKEYVAQRQEKENLERTIRMGHLSPQHLVEAQQRIAVLNEIMVTNPVSELMDDGMYQTLVEDVSQEDDPYSYQSGLASRLDRGTRWVPKPVKTVAKTMFMTHDTWLYKSFNDLTVMSDFTSRYVLNEHLKNRVTKKVTPEERRRRVRDAFVDYDVPTSKAMQYLNDMGLVWFSKYYMRIQHVIFQMVRENPLRALQIWGVADYLFSLPDILDSNWLSKDLGNSLGTGAFEILDAPREIYTLHVAGL